MPEADDELHGLLRQATEEIDRLDRALADSERAKYEPVAIVGLAVRFPGPANTPDAYWQLLKEGREAIAETAARWRETAPSWKGQMQGGGKWAGLIEGYDLFDAEYFNITPREAARVDPQHRLVLEVASEAFERAGYTPEQLVNSRTGVFAGQTVHDYEQMLAAQRQQKDVYSVTGNIQSFIAGRLSYALGLQGPCIALDTACSSSLVAVHLACQSLRSNESDCAVACASNLLLWPQVMEGMTTTNALSADGRCKTFDAQANGYVRSEGCGALILKRLSDAKRDGDTIWALVRGSAVNQDGRSSGLTAPNRDAQVKLLRAALNSARVAAADVNYIEAHGTGTPLGDPIEMDALREVFGTPRVDGSNLFVGSVKTNIGHLEAAAGMAGMIKVILAMQNETIPHQLNFKRLNPRITLEGTPLRVADTHQPWPRRDKKPRFAGISGFALSGTNAHVVLQEAPPVDVAMARVPSHETVMLPLSARTEKGLHDQARSLAGYLRGKGATTPLQGISQTLGVRRAHHRSRLAILGTTHAECTDALFAFADGIGSPQAVSAPASPVRRRVAFVFSGQGSQWIGMGRDLLASAPVFAEALRACDAAIQVHTGWSVIERMHTSAAADFERSDVVQPAIFAVQVSLAALWRHWGVEPDAVVGHSMGEVAAAHVAGILSLADAARVICARSKLVQSVAGQGGMMMIDSDAATVEKIVAAYPTAGIAAYNGRGSIVVSGEPDALVSIEADCKSANAFCRRIKVEYASHGPQMDALMSPLEKALDAVVPLPGTLLFCSTVSGAAAKDPLDARYWAQNLRRPVLFAQAMQTLWASGIRLFIEISPHRVLINNADKVLRALQENASAGEPVTVVGSLERDKPERAVLLRNLAEVYVAGAQVGFRGAAPRLPDLPTYVWQRERHWCEPEDGASSDNAVGLVEMSTGHAFETLMLDATDMACTNQHRVQGSPVMPGAAYLEMLLGATRASQPASHVLSHVVFGRMLKFEEGVSPRLQIALSPPEAGIRAASVSSAGPAGWSLHASAQVVRDGQVGSSSGLKLDVLKKQFSLKRDPQSMYTQLAERGLQYGAPYQGVREIWSDTGDALSALVRVDVHRGGAASLRAGATLDACFHAMYAIPTLNEGSQANRLFVPHTIEYCALQPMREGADTLWVWARLDAPPSSHSQAPVRANLLMFTEDGNLLGEFRGFTLSPLSASEESLQDAEYVMTWRAQARREAAKLPVARWLVLSRADDQVGALLVAGLRGAGHEVDAVTIEATERVHALTGEAAEQCVKQALAGSQVLSHVVICDSRATDTHDVAAEIESACRTGLNITQAVLKFSAYPRPRLAWVSCGAMPSPTANAPATQLHMAAMWGFLRSLATEHPDLHPTRIDLASTMNAEQAAAAALEELTYVDVEDEIALGIRTRHVMRLERPAKRSTSPFVAKSDGSYLVSGGGRGLGLAVAEWLVGNGARNVVLLGPSALSDESQKVVARLNEHGAKVALHRGDVAKASDVEAALVLARSFGPLRGVIHSAGVVDDLPFLGQTWPRFSAVMQPKAIGAWQLHVATRNDALDFFCLFSSFAGIIGTPRQANHAAASTFLDALAHLRHQEQRPGLSINWGVWDEIGYAARRSDREELTNMFGGISTKPGLAALGRLLQGGAAQAVVCPAHWAVLRKRGMGIAPRFADIAPVVAEAPQANADLVSVTLERLKNGDTKVRRDALHEAVHEGVKRVLGIQNIDDSVSLFEAGMDSLMTVDLVRYLEKVLQRRLPVAMVLEQPSIGLLVTYLDQLISEPETHEGA